MLIINYLSELLFLSTKFLPNDGSNAVKSPISGSNNQPLEQQPLQNSIDTSRTHFPLVFWHGMGDSYNSSSMQGAEDVIREVYPDLFIHSIYVEEADLEDQKASIIGDVTVQTLKVCDELKGIPELADGFNAIGFSQGGLFLRGAMEMCGLPIKNLITYGSPHNGFYDLPRCVDDSWVCKKRNEYLKKQMYTPRFQNSVVQAQYFRDVEDYDNYIANSNYLRFVNNEFVKDVEYYDNFVRLENLVLVMFLKDETLVPGYSAWFFDTDPYTGELLKFEETIGFKDDSIGLKKLYKDRKVQFLAINEPHMSIPDEHLKFVAVSYL